MGIFSRKHKKTASSVSKESADSPPTSPASARISQSSATPVGSHPRASADSPSVSSPLRQDEHAASKRLPLPPSNVSTTPLPPTPHAEDTSRIQFPNSPTSSRGDQDFSNVRIPSSRAAEINSFRPPTHAASNLQEQPQEEAEQDNQEFLPAQNFDSFSVPLPASQSNQSGINELASQLRQAEIADSRRVADAPGNLRGVGLAADSVAGAADDSTLRAAPQSETVKAVGGGRDSLPVNTAAGPAASTELTDPAVDRENVPSHHQQQLALLEKIRASHHPRTSKLNEVERRLFQTAGLPIVDGEGTVDWEEEWGTPVVKETVFTNQHVEYQTQIHVDRHVHHVHQKVQPILNPPSDLPEDELHYFQDSQGNWREIRGRALALEILGSLSESQRAADQPYDYWDSRAVEAEWKEMRDLVETGRQEYETITVTKKMTSRPLFGQAESILKELKFWEKDRANVDQRDARVTDGEVGRAF